MVFYADESTGLLEKKTSDQPTIMTLRPSEIARVVFHHFVMRLWLLKEYDFKISTLGSKSLDILM